MVPSAGGTYRNHWAVKDELSTCQNHSITFIIYCLPLCHISSVVTLSGGGAHVVGLSEVGVTRIRIFALMTTKYLQIVRYTTSSG